MSLQIYPGAPNFLLSAHSQATNNPSGYIQFNLTQDTPEDLRVVTDIFDNEITVYLPVNSKTIISYHHDTEVTTWK